MVSRDAFSEFSTNWDQLDSSESATDWNVCVFLFTEIVDNVMAEDDIDEDGYLTYPEYIMARRREDSPAPDSDHRHH